MGNLQSSQNQPRLIFQSSQLVPPVSALSPSLTSRILHRRSSFEINCLVSSIPSNGFLTPNRKLMLLKEYEREVLEGIFQTNNYLGARIDKLFQILMELSADNYKISKEVIEHRSYIKKIQNDLLHLEHKVWLARSAARSCISEIEHCRCR